MASVDLRTIQAPLKARYRDDPASAAILSVARSVPYDPSDPQHCVVAPEEFPALELRSGLHPAAGGAGDVPCSGDILATALVICAESTIRSVAANMGVTLDSVHVEARIHWDFRGTMGVDRAAPVGATRIELRSRVKVKEGMNKERARRLLESAERYCATLQTLRNGVAVETDLRLD